MATNNIIPNMMAGDQVGVNKGIQALGTPPVGNAAGSTMPGPSGIADANGVNLNPIMQQPAATSNLLTPGGIQGAIPVSQQNASDKQLTDTFGKGIGGDINSVINNLGSGDSSYLQAYQAAMAPVNAENQATLDTTLGNQGVSANSSTAAIANADFLSNVSTQTGLQEQQLQQTDEQNLIGLLSGVAPAANKEASTSVWGDIGDVLGAVGKDVGEALPLLL